MEESSLPDSPAPLGKAAAPSPAAVILQTTPSGLYGGPDPVFVNNIAWIVSLAKWALRTAFVVVPVLLFVSGWLLTIFVDMRSKINSVDDRIKAEVSTQVNDVRKEFSAEAKQQSEELTLLRTTIEIQQAVSDMVCQGAYEEALAHYGAYREQIKPKDIPDAMKSGVYRLLLTAVANSQKLHYLNDDELAKIEAVLRKDTTQCGGTHIATLSQIYMSRGNFDRARALCLVSIDLVLNTKSGNVVQDNAAFSYYLLMMIDLAQQKPTDPKERAQASWATLRILQDRHTVSTTVLLPHFRDPLREGAKNAVALASGGPAYIGAYNEIIRMLEISDFVKVEREIVGTDGVKKRVISTVEVRKSKDEKKVGNPQDAPPMKCCGG